jgi:prepilin-type N-terminal cleavage/methylation domain-containing protein
MMVLTGKQESGFTLLEVLVTLAILAVGTALTLSLISGTLANIRKVQLRTKTIQHAETVMELALLDDGIRQPTSFRGDFEDGTRWSVQVDEVPTPEQPASNPQMSNLPQIGQSLKLFSYTVDVTSPDARTPDFTLKTLKIVSVQQPATPFRMPR